MHYHTSQYNKSSMDIQIYSRDELKCVYIVNCLAFISMPKPFDILFLIHKILLAKLNFSIYNDTKSFS